MKDNLERDRSVGSLTFDIIHWNVKYNMRICEYENDATGRRFKVTVFPFQSQISYFEY